MKKFIVGIGIFLSALLIILVFLCLLFPLKYRKEIDKYSAKYNLSPSVVASIINIESGFDSKSKSKAGACGLMQLLPSTASECALKLGIDFKGEQIYDVDMNILLGCYYFSYLLDVFDKNLTNALCAYNWGLGNVKEWLSIGNIDSNGTITNIPVKETKEYISKFEMSRKIYKTLYRLS